jgi:hypothetical protein
LVTDKNGTAKICLAAQILSSLAGELRYLSTAAFGIGIIAPLQRCQSRTGAIGNRSKSVTSGEIEEMPEPFES